MEMKKGVCYPLEMISVDVKNKYLRRLDPDQQMKASSFQAMKPAEKLGFIRSVRSQSIEELCIPLLAECGILIESDPKTVDGRLLAPPTIEYATRDKRGRSSGHTKVAPNPADGSWMMRFARGVFAQGFIHGGMEINSLAIIQPSRADRHQTLAFFSGLFEKAAALGQPFPLCAASLTV